MAQVDRDEALLLARTRVGLWVVLVAIVAFTLADERLAPAALHPTTLVRLVPISGTKGIFALLAYDPCVRRVYQPAALP
jgi:hypothetical protein